ncbi:hypothetical protein Tco_0682254 [Tanacetum coccineum]|uniref:Uncharacterized protein n=1 Tax=Tanacetum coccineum TaxID=301880 RepID=A0ABQ4XQM6_9ASTR
MAVVDAYEETERVQVNCTSEDTLQQASTSGTQSDSAPVYDLDRSAENDSNDIYVDSSMEQGGGTVEQHSATIEETRAYHESLFHNLAAEVEKVNSDNRKMKETNADLTIELARYKNQEKCFEISQEKYDKLERCYQKSIYQEQCLTKKINALNLSSGKQITTLNEEISNLNKQLSKEKSTVSSLLEEKKKLKSDFKIREDELLDKQIQLENKIKELDNILIKTETDESIAKQKALELEIERLLRAVVSQDIMSIVQCNSAVDTSKLQTELEHMKERFENCIIKKKNEYAKLWNDWYKKCEECKYHKISYDKAYNDMQQKIQRLQAQMGDQKGKSKDTPYVSNTLDPLSQKLENENVELKFQDTTHGTSTNTKFAKQSILGKPPSSSRPKLYAETPLPKSKAISKIDESHALSKPVTSNSVHTSTESKVMKNDNVISPRLFRINPFKASRYVNGMKSREKNQSANVLKSANQKKHKPRVWKPKKVGSKERLASPKPSTSRSCLRWYPTGRMFVLKGNIIATSESECQSDCFKGDNACTSNPQELISKRFPNSTFSMTCGQNWFDALLIPLLFRCALPKKEEKSSCFHFSRYDSHVVNDRVRKSIRSFALTNYSNGENQVVSKSSTVTDDASDKRHQQQDSTSSTSTLATTITADGNFDL